MLPEPWGKALRGGEHALGVAWGIPDGQNNHDEGQKFLISCTITGTISKKMPCTNVTYVQIRPMPRYPKLHISFEIESWRAKATLLSIFHVHYLLLVWFPFRVNHEQRIMKNGKKWDMNQVKVSICIFNFFIFEQDLQTAETPKLPYFPADSNKIRSRRRFSDDYPCDDSSLQIVSELTSLNN